MNFDYQDKSLGSKINSSINNRLICGLILLSISFLVFIPSLKNDFVWDDLPYILQRINKLTIDNQISTLNPSEKRSKYTYFRPTLHLSLALDNQIWNGSAQGFHLSNIIFHALSTLGVYLAFFLILSRFGIKRKEEISFLASLFFALHPMHVESVSFIMARSDLLCSFFLLYAFILYIKSYDYRWFYSLPLLILSGVFYYLGLLSKEVAYIFPIVILIFDLLSPKKNITQYVYRYVSVALIFLAYVYIRKKAFVLVPSLSANIFDASDSTFDIIYAILANSLNAFGYYFYKLLLPFTFNASPGRLDPGPIFIILAIVVFVSLAMLINKFRSPHYKPILLSLSWIIITVTPAVVASLFDIVTSPYAERFLYIPSVGYCLLFAYLLNVFLFEHDKYRKFFYTGIVLICLVFAVLIIREQANWKNNLALWKVTSERSPRQIMPHLNYGFSLLTTGQTEMAIDELKKSLGLEAGKYKDQKAIAANNIGNAYLNKRDYGNAKKYFKIALKNNPKYKATYYYHLGLIDYLKANDVYYKDGKAARSLYKSAAKHLQKSHRIAPDYAVLNLLMAEVYVKLGEINKAKGYSKKALKRYKGTLSDDMMKRARQISKMKAK